MNTFPLGVGGLSRCGVLALTGALVVITPKPVRSQAVQLVDWSEIRQGRSIQFVHDTLGELRSLRGTVVRKDEATLAVFWRQGQDTVTWRVPITSLLNMAVRDWRYNWKGAAIGAVLGTLAGPLLVFSICLEGVKCPQDGNGALWATGATTIVGFALGGQRRRWMPVRLPITPPPP